MVITITIIIIIIIITIITIRDCYLINLIEQLKETDASLKPVITTYPLGYTLPDNYPDDVRATLLIPTKFDDNGILRQSGRAINLTPNQIHSTLRDRGKGGLAMACPLWAAGFNFSERSSFLVLLLSLSLFIVIVIIIRMSLMTLH